MVVSDQDRRSLYDRLVEVLGEAHADTLMETLPPVPASHLATKGDTEALGDRLEERMDRFEVRMDRFEVRMDRLEERMDRLEVRMDRIDERMDEFYAKLDTFDERLHDFHHILRSQIHQIVIAQSATLASLALVALAAAQIF